MLIIEVIYYIILYNYRLRIYENYFNIKKKTKTDKLIIYLKLDPITIQPISIYQLLPKNKLVFNGDDYQILFTASQKNRSLIKSIGKRMNQKFTIIGKINNGYKKNSINLDNKPLNLSNFKGYSHKF